MRFIKRRRLQPAPYQADMERPREIRSHRVKRCGVCTYEFPEEDMVVEDGREVCPLCMDLYTAAWLENEERDVANVKTESARRLMIPPQFSVRSLHESTPGAVTLITDSSNNVLGQSSPLLVKRNVAFTVLLVGQYFTSANTITYPTGMTDNTAPVITPALITLNPIAASTMTTGTYGITFNDGISKNGHVFPYLFLVR